MTANRLLRQTVATPSPETETSLSTRTYLSWLWGLSLLDALIATRSMWLALALLVPFLLLSRFLARSPSGVRSSLVGLYGYSGPMRRDPMVFRVMVIGLVASAIAALVLGGPSGFVGLFASVATLFHSTCDNRIVIARRFVSVNDRLLFFEDLEKVVSQGSVGANRFMELHSKTGPVLRIEQDLFPTNARKPHKIALNREGKMRRVSDRILKQLGRYPHVKIIGSLDTAAAPTP